MRTESQIMITSIEYFPTTGQQLLSVFLYNLFEILEQFKQVARKVGNISFLTN